MQNPGSTKLSESITLVHQENESAIAALKQMMQSRLKYFNEQIDSHSQSIETVERTKIEEVSIIQVKSDKLDNELDKTRARVEVVEQRASEEEKELDRPFAQQQEQFHQTKGESE
jgi:flagellar capping protein FliD